MLFNTNSNKSMPSPDVNQVSNLNGYYITFNHITGTSFLTTPYGTGNGRRELVRTTSSAKTPGFRTLPKAKRPINPYSYREYVVNDPLSIITERTTGPTTNLTRLYYQSTTGSWISATSRFPGTEFTADDPTQRAVNDLLEEIKLAKANASVTLAEAHKTAAFVSQTATKLVKAIKALKSGHFGDFTTALGLTAQDWQRKRFYKNRARTFDQTKTKAFELKSTQQNHKSFAESTWLEYSYAWKPMLKDVYDLSLALSETVMNQGNITRYVKCRARTSGNRTFVSDLDKYQIYHKTIESKRWCEIGLYYKIPPNALSTGAAFGLTNPLEVAWELVPFSFVADWFLPIGDALRALTATDGLIFAGGYKTTKSLKTVRYVYRGKGLPVAQSGGNLLWYTGTASYESTEFVMNRSILQTWPSYGFPQWKDPRSFAHAASAIALLSSLFLGKK